MIFELNGGWWHCGLDVFFHRRSISAAMAGPATCESMPTKTLCVDSEHFHVPLWTIWGADAASPVRLLMLLISFRWRMGSVWKYVALKINDCADVIWNSHLVADAAIFGLSLDGEPHIICAWFFMLKLGVQGHMLNFQGPIDSLHDRGPQRSLIYWFELKSYLRVRKR